MVEHPAMESEPRNLETDTGREDKPMREHEAKSQRKQWIEERADAIWQNLGKNNLWQRIIKNTLATTLAVIVALVPAVVEVYGSATYLAPMTTVFGHPGRRFGQMAEALILTLVGVLLGTAWSTLGIYLSSLVYDQNELLAYTVRAIFLVVVVLLHGFLRSHSPRLFIGVLLMIIVSVVSLTSTTTTVSGILITTLLYPILTAIGILLLVNICVFPEFSSSFLGITTIETLRETVGALGQAGKYFLLVNLPDEAEPQVKVGADDSLPKPSPAAKALREKRRKSFRASSVNKCMTARQGNQMEPNWNHDLPVEFRGEVTLKSLTTEKSKLRSKLSSCKEAQQECNFELAFAVLPPRDLKFISDITMKRLVANTIALIGACESKFALIGHEEDLTRKKQDKGKSTSTALNRYASHERTLPDESSADEKEKEDGGGNLVMKVKTSKGKTRIEREIAELELIKPRKEIEFGDQNLLRLLVKGVSGPIVLLQSHIDKSVGVVSACLAYCYDVPNLPGGTWAPKGLTLEEIDIWADSLLSAISDFDNKSAIALEELGTLYGGHDLQVDLMPRIETFLISSFLLNLREAALRIHEMLVHSRELVEKRQCRNEQRRLYAPRINWRKWLTSGGEEDSQALPSRGRKDARTGTASEAPENDIDATRSDENVVRKQGDEELGGTQFNGRDDKPIQRTSSTKKSKKNYRNLLERARNFVADAFEYAKGSDDVTYALKLTTAVLLVIWPAFLSNWARWFYLNRGLWAALQLVLVTEVAIGSSIAVFILRAVGTTLGCVWGFAAYQTGSGNRVVCVVMLVIGIIPSAYVQLGTKYVKAGMVSIISMCVVALATEDQTVPGTATQNFLKRWIAFLIGGCVALTIEIVLYPVKARDRLVESLAASIRQICEMEACLAHGIETEINVDVHSLQVSERFDSAKSKAQVSLAAAETFLPFCSQEPRLKGSFAGLALVYAEITYVLHQITDKMDSMLQFRREYGSRVLEELNAQVFPYRRNVAASITLALFAVHEALTTKLPLPQFLPSARLAHLRMVNRVRDVVLTQAVGSSPNSLIHADKNPQSADLQMESSLVKSFVEKRFLSWSAATAGQTEIIEYLEELMELTKLLVGVNEFRSGMLTRPTFREYIARVGEKHHDPEFMNDRQESACSDLEIDKSPRGLSKTPAEKRTADFIGQNPHAVAKSGTTSSPWREIKEVGRQNKLEEDKLPTSLLRMRTRRLETVTSRTH